MTAIASSHTPRAVEPVGFGGIVAWIARPFAIDYRSLALFRVCLGLCLLADLKSRLDDLSVFHTDTGVLPRIAVLQFWDSSFLNSIFMMSGSYWITLALLLIGGVVFFCYLIGYRTRLVGILALLFLVSEQIRNFTIVQGSDDLLRVLLFWALFLPTNRRFSVDAALDDRPEVRNVHLHFSAATIGLLLQASYVYLMGALIKSTDPIWFPNGEAIYYAMNIDQFNTIWSPYLRAMPHVMQALTYFVFFLELLSPILMLQPIATKWFRFAILPLLIGMHLGFMLFLTVGLFPFVSITSLLIFTPSAFWDRAHKMLSKRQRIAAMYYDQHCQFCYKICLLLRHILILGPVEIAPAQPVPGIGEVLERNNSWVVVDTERRLHLKWEAVATVFASSPIFFWLAPLVRLNPKFGEHLYDWIGANRARLGRLTGRLLPLRPLHIRRNWLAEIFIGAVVVFILAWNFGTLPGRETFMPGWAKQLALVTRLEQKWDMFAPHPLILDGYYVMRGTLTDGRPVDVLRHTVGEVSFDKPADVSGMYEDQKWRKYLVNLTGEQYVALRFWYASWQCRQWNNGDLQSASPLTPKLATMDIWFVLEPTPPPGGQFKYERRLLWQHRCL